MMWARFKYVALTALLAVGLAGFGIRHWVSASDRTADALKHAVEVAQNKDGAKADEAKPAVPARRREAVISLPLGTFVKEVDVAPYGRGRITWVYEEERVGGLIEGSVMGFEFELATEAEISLSSNGTIYGLLTNVRVSHLRLPDTGDLADELGELKPFLGLLPAVEPLINEVLTDLPFSYQFRVQGDRLILSNFRILLAGPNPLGKLGGVFAADNEEAFMVLAAFQGLGTALEGTYAAPDSRDKPPVEKRRLFPSKPNRPAEAKPAR
jgi:hypothetical protein